jgi:hypothetical protein
MESGVWDRRIGRYLLEDLVTETAGTALWRATDPALQRPVGVRLVPTEDPRMSGLREAAARAARVHDRRIVRVLDVVETDRYLGIVTEWVTGEPWSDLLVERWMPQEAAIVALEVGRALDSAHRSGATHGRIRPDSVMITDTREVRLRGLEVDSALWGVEPPGDPWIADLNGTGSVLYAGLTRHWPGPRGVDGLASAPDHNGPPVPSALAPDVPADLDRIVARSVTSVRTPADSRPFADVSECVLALEDALGRIGTSGERNRIAEDTDNATDRLLSRLGTITVMALALAGLGLLLWQLTVGRAGGGVVDDGAALAAAAPRGTPLPPAQESPFPIVASRDFDPGGDGQENRRSVRLAYDSDRRTAWRTESYTSAEPGGSAGVGVVFDLGAVRPVRAIDLKLAGSGADFEIATATGDPGRLQGYRTVVDITGSGDKIKVRTPTAVNARFILVKLTRLPFDGSTYSGGLREVTILG